METHGDPPVVDLEQGGGTGNLCCSAVADGVDGDDFTSVEYSDAEDGGGSSLFEDMEEEEEEEEKGRRWSIGSTGKEIVGGSAKGRGSSVSDCSLDVDLESGIVEKKVDSGKVSRDCRICHLSFDGSSPESGAAIELGCSCKEDLAAAHKQCAETWFKIRGNKTCEICGFIAMNVVGTNDVELIEQRNIEATEVTSTAVAPINQPGTQNFWQGHRFLNFLLACMVFAFVISWLFHFNVPS